VTPDSPGTSAPDTSPTDSPKPPDSPKPADSPPAAAPAAESGKLDQVLGLLQRFVNQQSAAAPAAAAPASPVQQEQQAGTPGAVVVTPPTVTPEVSIPTPPVRAPEPQSIIVAQPVAPTVIAPPRQLKTGDRVTHSYHDDYGSGPGGTDVVDHGIVVEQTAKQVDDGNGQSHLEYYSRVAWLRDVSDPLAEGSLELQA